MPRPQVFVLRAFLLLAIVGALNWGAIGVFDFDFVAALLGGVSHQSNATIASRVVYALVGAAGVGLVAIFPQLNDKNVQH